MISGGRLGSLQVKGAEPDGSIILLAPSSTLVIYPHVFSDLRYNPFADFAPVAHLTDWHMCFVVGAQVPARTLGARLKADYEKWGAAVRVPGYKPTP